MWAAAGITIPVIIHLWNVQQGKILKVGSIALLAKDTTRNTSSIKLHELLLLLLRCLLIILLAMLLSQPLWRSTATGSQKGWVLIDKTDVHQTYSQCKKQVDSLLLAGYEFHYFNKGFEKTEFKDALDGKEDTAAGRNISYWGLISLLNKTLDSKLPVYIFTDNSLNSFTGNRPGVSLNLHWYTYTAPNVPSTTLTKAYSIPGDSIRVITANSIPTGTVNKYNDVSQAQLKSAGYMVSPGNNGLLLSDKNEVPVTIDTAALHITIYSEKYPNDASYIKAAIDAIQQFSKHKIIASVIADVSHMPAQQDWLFWLSEEPIPNAVNAKNIFSYQQGKEYDISSWIIEWAENKINAGQIALYKYIPSQQTSNPFRETIWQDGFGHALLNKEEGKTNMYNFYSRFDPSWNELPWSNNFPQMMFALLFKQDNLTTVSDVNDKRIIDKKQLQPYFVKEAESAIKKGNMSTDISPFFWFAAFIIFFIERIISLRTKKERTYA